MGHSRMVIAMGIAALVGAGFLAAEAGPAPSGKPGGPAKALEPPQAFLPLASPGTQWRLAWHDEFDGKQLDETRWEILGDWKRRDGFWVKAGSSLDGQGHLVLRTAKDGDRFTSGAVRTQGKFEHRFGYWECRGRFGTQPGHWPAFWLFSRPGVDKIGSEGRDGTEIDIMEKPWLTDQVNHALHWDGYGPAHRSAGKKAQVPGVSAGWHTFGLHWKPDEYVFYVDGKETWRTSAGGVSQVPAFVKLTDEIGDWGGDIRKARLPDDFLVDYVRVFDAVEPGKEAPRAPDGKEAAAGAAAD